MNPVYIIEPTPCRLPWKRLALLVGAALLCGWGWFKLLNGGL